MNLECHRRANNIPEHVFTAATLPSRFRRALPRPASGIFDPTVKHFGDSPVDRERPALEGGID